MVKRVFVCALFSVFSVAFAITENEVVLEAIKKSPDAKIISFESSRDTITYKKALAGRSLSLTVGAAAEFQPATSIDVGGASDSSDKSLSSSYYVTANQPIAGGGSIKLSASNAFSKSFPADGVDGSKIEVGVSQPLLKGSWGRGDTDISIKIANNNIKLGKVKFRDGISKAVAGARIAFWDWVLAIKTVDITAAEMAYADSLKFAAVAKFKVGTGTETDTLRAAIEVLRSFERNMAARHRERQAGENLAYLIGRDIGSISSPEKFDNVPELYSYNEAADSLKALNYSIAAIENSLANLKLFLESGSNKLLPSLDVNAGYRISGSGDSPFSGNLASALSPAKSGAFIGATINWDILAKGTRLDNEENRNKEKSMDAEKEKMENELSFRLKQLYDAWRQDSLSLSVRETEIVIAEKAYSQMQESYRLGASGSLELERAKNDLINARLNRLSSEISLRKAIISVDLLTGVILNRFGVKLQ